MLFKLQACLVHDRRHSASAIAPPSPIIQDALYFRTIKTPSSVSISVPSEANVASSACVRKQHHKTSMSCSTNKATLLVANSTAVAAVALPRSHTSGCAQLYSEHTPRWRTLPLNPQMLEYELIKSVVLGLSRSISESRGRLSLNEGQIYVASYNL